MHSSAGGGVSILDDVSTLGKQTREWMLEMDVRKVIGTQQVQFYRTGWSVLDSIYQFSEPGKKKRQQ